ncbi:MAG: hypothetical protein KF831_11320 [Acidobacteria bacterium]|nr:hypothetical protein [Acidobacteriota bacterium]
MRTGTGSFWFLCHYRAAAVVVACLIAAGIAHAQELPDRIRGYKVHKQIVTVRETAGPTDASSPMVASRIDPEQVALKEISLTGVSFEMPIELSALPHSGRVDFITFSEMTVNDIPVAVDEFRTEFRFRKGEKVLLPSPVTIFFPAHRLVQAAWREMRDSQPKWRVRGRVFVFGRFKRFGIHHKRVVPVDIDINIDNPVIRARK